MLGGWSHEGIDPFQLLIGTILSARCRDEVTEVISRKLFERYPTAERLAAAPAKDVQRIIKPIGFYRMKAKYVIETARRVLKRHGGKVPLTLEELTDFPGVGRKVANCVLVYAFGKPAIPVDTHVHRVSNRLGWVKTKSPEQTERALAPILPKRHWLEVNELLVAHGKAVCRPVRPLCARCPAEASCPKVGVTSPVRPSAAAAE
jgi:endonuclease-3